MFRVHTVLTNSASMGDVMTVSSDVVIPVGTAPGIIDSACCTLPIISAVDDSGAEPIEVFTLLFQNIDSSLRSGATTPIGFANVEIVDNDSGMSVFLAFNYCVILYCLLDLLYACVISSPL